MVAVEKDPKLFEMLNEQVRSKKLDLINLDFFRMKGNKLDADIMISNIPYNLSSRVLGWLGEKQMPGVLCLQKEFVAHMLAKQNEANYSRLSVFAALQFSMTYIMDVPASDFYPMPRVNSSLVYLRPKKLKISKKAYEILALIMMHKKKKIRNALADSSKTLGMDRHIVAEIAGSIKYRDSRPFQLSPEELLETSSEILKVINGRTNTLAPGSPSSRQHSSGFS